MEGQAHDQREQLRLWIGHALLALMGAMALAASVAWAALAPGSSAVGTPGCGHAAQSGCESLACAVLSRLAQVDLCIELEGAADGQCACRLELLAHAANSGLVLRDGRPVRWHRDERGAPCLHDGPVRLFGVAGFDLPRAARDACGVRR